MRTGDAADFSDPFEEAPLFAMSTEITFTREEVSTYYAARVPKLKQQRAGEWRGPCPIHGGKDDNFAVDAATGRWFCHSTCGRGGDILALEEALTSGDFPARKAEVSRIVGRNEPAYRSHGARRDGNPAQRAPTKPTKRNGQSSGWREVERYQYLDEAGNLRFEVVRQERGQGVQRKKKFLQRRPDDQGGWIWNLDGVDPLLYRLPELLKRSTETVYLSEGERCVHTLEAWGLLATCNPMGAGNWRSEYSAVLRGRAVVILPDNDEPGRKHAAAVAAALMEVVASVRMVELPGLPEKGDIADWRDSGGTLEEFQSLASAQPALKVEDLATLQVRWELNTASADELGVSNGGPKSSAFRLTDEAVLYCDPDPEIEPLRICGRLEVSALTRDAKGDGWGRLLRWHDSEGRVHEWAMPMSLLAGDGNEYRARLLDGGLFLAPGRKAREKLTVYLQTAHPETRALCVARVGWQGENFILPGATIGPEGAEKVLFQTPFDTDHYLNVSGTLTEWRENVGRLCSGNSRLILAASCAFAGPLLDLVGGESGGVHFVGTTSTGKSTALLVGGSVLGGGGRNGFAHSWRTTANGLEAVAELHNDLTLFLDELSQIDPREAAETAYLLGNGSGKTRMSRNIGARKKLVWSLLFVSAGEITLADHGQTAGKRTKGGAEVRLINVDADAGAGMGLFENIHGAASPDAFARQLKDAARQFYGTPLRAHLDFIAQNRPATEKAVRNFQTEFLKSHVPAGASGEVYRAAQRFALIGAAGELATAAGITGWSPDEAMDAAARCLASWIENRGTAGSGDSEAAIRQVRSFLEVNGSGRFQEAKARVTGCGDPIHGKVINRAGFRVDEDGETTVYLILPEVFQREVCEGFNYRTVANALKERGFLETQPPHLTKKCRLPEVGNVRVYAVSSSILEG